MSIESTGVSAYRDLIDTSLQFPKWSTTLLKCLETLNVSRSAFTRLPLENSLQSVKACIQALEIITSPSNLLASHSRMALFRESVLWSLQCYRRLWKVAFSWFETVNSPLEEDRIVTLLMDLILLNKKCFSCCGKLGLGLEQGSVDVLIQSGVDMLSSPKIRRSLDLQHALSQLLSEAMRISHGSPGVDRLIEENFLQALKELQSDSAAFANLHQSFQVALPPKTPLQSFMLIEGSK